MVFFSRKPPCNDPTVDSHQKVCGFCGPTLRGRDFAAQVLGPWIYSIRVLGSVDSKPTCRKKGVGGFLSIPPHKLQTFPQTNKVLPQVSNHFGVWDFDLAVIQRMFPRIFDQGPAGHQGRTSFVNIVSVTLPGFPIIPSQARLINLRSRILGQSLRK